MMTHTACHMLSFKMTHQMRCISYRLTYRNWFWKSWQKVDRNVDNFYVDKNVDMHANIKIEMQYLTHQWIWKILTFHLNLLILKLLGSKSDAFLLVYSQDLTFCPFLRTIRMIRTVRTAQRTGRLGIIFLILEKRMLIRMRLKKNLFQSKSQFQMNPSG